MPARAARQAQRVARAQADWRSRAAADWRARRATQAADAAARVRAPAAGAARRPGPAAAAKNRRRGRRDPPQEPRVPSAGCGKATAVTNGKKTITSGGKQRTYIIDIPTNYDMNKPYRFFYTSHWISSTAEAVQRPELLLPQAAGHRRERARHLPRASGAAGNPNGTWDTSKNIDHILFDDILAFVKAEPVHRHHARLRHRVQLRRHDDLLALRESPEGHSRRRGDRSGQLQHLRAHQDAPTHRLDANDRHERRYVSMGQREQHDPRREVHCDRARHR